MTVREVVASYRNRARKTDGGATPLLLRHFEVTFRFFGSPRDAARNEGCFAAVFLRPFSVGINEATGCRLSEAQ